MSLVETESVVVEPVSKKLRLTTKEAVRELTSYPFIIDVDHE
jgi:hypothetical protein